MHPSGDSTTTVVHSVHGKAARVRGRMIEGSGLEQMSPELENKAFSAKSTQYMALKRHKESYNTEVETRKRGM